MAASVSWVLMDWARKTPGFDVGGNEAGIILAGEVRGLDGAVWKSTGKKRTNRFRRSAPLLAVEVQGEDETIDSLRKKAAWYLEHGTGTVWLVLTSLNVIVVVTEAGEKRVRERERVPEPVGLKGLSPLAADVFWRAT